MSLGSAPGEPEIRRRGVPAGPRAGPGADQRGPELSDTCADLADALRPLPGMAPDDPIIAGFGRLRAERTAALLDEAASAARGDARVAALRVRGAGQPLRRVGRRPAAATGTWPDAFVEVPSRTFTVEDEAGTAVAQRRGRGGRTADATDPHAFCGARWDWWCRPPSRRWSWPPTPIRTRNPRLSGRPNHPGGAGGSAPRWFGRRTPTARDPAAAWYDSAEVGLGIGAPQLPAVCRSPGRSRRGARRNLSRCRRRPRTTPGCGPGPGAAGQTDTPSPPPRPATSPTAAVRAGPGRTPVGDGPEPAHQPADHGGARRARTIEAEPVGAELSQPTPRRPNPSRPTPSRPTPSPPTPWAVDPLAADPLAAEPVTADPCGGRPLAADPLAAEPSGPTPWRPAIGSDPLAAEPIASEPDRGATRSRTESRGRHRHDRHRGGRPASGPSRPPEPVAAKLAPTRSPSQPSPSRRARGTRTPAEPVTTELVRTNPAASSLVGAESVTVEAPLLGQYRRACPGGACPGGTRPGRARPGGLRLRPEPAALNPSARNRSAPSC